MNEKPIIALDFSTAAETKEFLDKFPSEQLYVKLGMELYYQNGPDIIRWVKNAGHQIFLDLKLHDIPHTVYRAMKGLAGMDVDMLNVHAAGGTEMMRAAKEGIMEGAKRDTRPLLIAVTQLTSTLESMMQKEQMVKASLLESVLHYAELANEAELDGVVCSAWEAERIKQQTSQNFLCITPGIRPSGFSKGDQKRVASPFQAREKGASYIVVGRPITEAENPLEAYLDIKKQWNGEQ